MVIKLNIETSVIGNVTKRGGRKVGGGGRRGAGAAVFCGPCVYLGIFLLF
jgi:hypothetical protein